MIALMFIKTTHTQTHTHTHSFLKLEIYQSPHAQALFNFSKSHALKLSPVLDVCHNDIKIRV